MARDQPLHQKDEQDQFGIGRRVLAQFIEDRRSVGRFERIAATGKPPDDHAQPHHQRDMGERNGQSERGVDRDRRDPAEARRTDEADTEPAEQDHHRPGDEAGALIGPGRRCRHVAAEGMALGEIGIDVRGDADEAVSEKRADEQDRQPTRADAIRPGSAAVGPRRCSFGHAPSAAGPAPVAALSGPDVAVLAKPGKGDSAWPERYGILAWTGCGSGRSRC